ncbi:DUF5615 family PIN-like protein [Planctomicrobium piriforme]|uniref:DUF5615 domain-containing protein n=1 Tax=Planctomicrobium piriforme TaxID=1576369 RepID=A0A1I3IH74_9PLAN|nr:DUF5615 family PIN-like protein [Planctomicrobium piriforme]SFI47133.1 hypothetical protein SAMN05421753_109116 [Planctomicrobium piriforme]
MPLGIYMDVHVPTAVTSALRRRGIDVLTSQEDGTTRATDEALLKRAIETERLFFTQDQDFLVIAQEYQASGTEFPGICFARQGVEVGRLIQDLELHLKCATAQELQNQLIFLPLR